MVAIECPVHGSRVMVPETRIRSLRNTAEGILVDVECWCGTRVAIRTGRRRVRMIGSLGPELGSRRASMPRLRRT